MVDAKSKKKLDEMRDALIDSARRSVEIAILEQLLEGVSPDVLLSMDEGSLIDIFEENDVELDDQLHFVFFTKDVAHRGPAWWADAIKHRERKN